MGTLSLKLITRMAGIIMKAVPLITLTSVVTRGQSILLTLKITSKRERLHHRQTSGVLQAVQGRLALYSERGSVQVLAGGARPQPSPADRMPRNVATSIRYERPIS